MVPEPCDSAPPTDKWVDHRDSGTQIDIVLYVSGYDETNQTHMMAHEGCLLHATAAARYLSKQTGVTIQLANLHTKSVFAPMYSSNMLKLYM